MARKRSRKQRDSDRKRLQLMLVVGLIAVSTIFLVVQSTNLGQSAEPVAEDRLQLDPIKGNPDAPVTIIEYGAYGCSACRAWHQAGIIEQILAEYPDQVRFIFRDFPVIYPTYDRMAAEIAQCALDQGEEGFWRLHDALYTTIPPGSSQNNIFQTAEQLGLNGDALRSCVEQGTHRATVQFHEDRARRLGLPGTPSFLINGQRIFSATPQILVREIEQALQEQ